MREKEKDMPAALLKYYLRQHYEHTGSEPDEEMKTELEQKAKADERQMKVRRGDCYKKTVELQECAHVCLLGFTGTITDKTTGASFSTPTIFSHPIVNTR